MNAHRERQRTAIETMRLSSDALAAELAFVYELLRKISKCQIDVDDLSNGHVMMALPDQLIRMIQDVVKEAD